MKSQREPGPEALLREHVETILDGASIPANERADVAEELYGHLWFLWHEEITRGDLDEFAAARAAIRDFGGRDQLSVGLTGAFHGALYASTIGLLLPSVPETNWLPTGFTTSRVLLGLTVIIWLILGPFAIWSQEWPPVIGLLQFGFAAFSLIMFILAFRALGRRQLWALWFVRILAVCSILGGFYAMATNGVILNLGFILGLLVLPGAFGREMDEWVAGSRQVGRGLAVVVLIGAAGPWTVVPALGAVPDPAQAQPSDLSMQVTLKCDGTGGQLTGGTATVEMRWTKTDFFPYGPLGFWKGMTDTDTLQLEEGNGGYPTNYITYLGETAVDVDSGADISSPMAMYTSQAYFNVRGAPLAIDPAAIHAGRRYRATFKFVETAPTDNGAQELAEFRVTYDHQRRWGLETLVQCGQTAEGMPTSRDVPTLGSGNFVLQP